MAAVASTLRRRRSPRYVQPDFANSELGLGSHADIGWHNIVAPEGILPSQRDLLGSSGNITEKVRGERALYADVLSATLSDLGITTASGHAYQSRPPRASRYHDWFREALRWVTEMDYGNLTFRTACEVLGIEPDAFRARILDRIAAEGLEDL